MGLLGDITGGLIGGKSSAEEAATEAKVLSAATMKKVLNELNTSFGISEEELSPYLKFGESALAEMYENRAGDPAAPELEIFDFDSSQVGESDAYKWRYEQGLNAAQRALAVNRNLNSGNRLAALTEYGQGAASQEYEKEFQRQAQGTTLRNAARTTQYGMDSGRFKDYMDRLKGMSTAGQNAATNLAGLRMNKAASVSNAYTGNAANQFAASLIPVQEKQNYISGLMNIAGQGAGAAMGK